MDQIDNLEDNMNKLAKQETVIELKKTLTPIAEKQVTMESRLLTLEQSRKTGSSNSGSAESSAPVTMTGVSTSSLSMWYSCCKILVVSLREQLQLNHSM